MNRSLRTKRPEVDCGKHEIHTSCLLLFPPPVQFGCLQRRGAGGAEKVLCSVPWTPGLGLQCQGWSLTHNRHEGRSRVGGSAPAIWGLTFMGRDTPRALITAGVSRGLHPSLRTSQMGGLTGVGRLAQDAGGL